VLSQFGSLDNITSHQFLLIYASVAYSGSSSPQPIPLRLLRTLPLSSNRLNALLLAPSLAGWLLIWILFVLSHVAFDRSLIPPPIDFVCLLVGLSAYGTACRLRWRWGIILTAF